MWVLTKGNILHNGLIYKLRVEDTLVLVTPFGEKINGVTEDGETWEFIEAGLRLKVKFAPAKMLWVYVNP